MEAKKVRKPQVSGLVRYPGGKSKLRKVINARLKRMVASVGPTAEYREPFFGAGSVGLSLVSENPGIRRAWLNDADPAMSALWHVVIHDPTSLHVAVEITPEAMRLFPNIDYYKGDVELLRSLTGPEDLRRVRPDDLAIAKLAAHQMSFSGLGSRAGGPMTQRLARFNVETLVSRIYASNEILTSVSLRNGTCTCLDFSAMFDAGGAVFYCDPPYYAAGPQLYQFAFTPDDHIRLACLLRGESRPWLLSYDDHPVIHELYGGWSDIDKVQVGCSINGSNRKNELLITNYEGAAS
jgi:DNA adenine methylase